MIESTDAASSTTRNEYDAMDRLTLVRDARESVASYEYDPVGNLLRMNDENGNTVQYIYDQRNRRIAAIAPDGGQTSFSYDADNNLTKLIDPVGNTTHFSYDARNRMTREIDPLGRMTVHRFDAVDNLIATTDRAGRVTEFVYDEVNRLVDELWFNPNADLVHAIQYDYDKASNLLSVADATSHLEFTYDARNRLVSADNAQTPDVTNVVLSYGYDDVGNVTSMHETISGLVAGTTSYVYDGLHRMTEIRQAGNGVSDKLVDLAYTQLGQFAEIERFADAGRVNLVARTEYQYDALNRLTDLDHMEPTDAVLAFYDFEYDPASRLTAITDIDGRSDFAYDDRDQLIGAQRGVVDIRGDEHYAYDANGNRTDSHTHSAGYVTGDANRLLSDGVFDYEYDAEGNMTAKTHRITGESRTFTYDHRNRLTLVSDSSAGGVTVSEVAYTYDAFDRRIARSVDADGAGAANAVTEHYVYDGSNVLLDFVDLDGSGDAVPELSSRYLFGPGIDRVMAQERVASGQTQWLLTDHLGGVRDVIDDNGALLNHITYDSFGDVINQTNHAATSRYLFTGRELDDAAGLYYYRARFYDAELGRFISEDPIGFVGGDVNLFTYVLNLPVQLTDSSGRQVDQFEIPGDDQHCSGEFCENVGANSATTESNAGATEASNDASTTNNDGGLISGMVDRVLGCFRRRRPAVPVVSIEPAIGVIAENPDEFQGGFLRSNPRLSQQQYRELIDQVEGTRTDCPTCDNLEENGVSR